MASGCARREDSSAIRLSCGFEKAIQQVPGLVYRSPSRVGTSMVPDSGTQCVFTGTQCVFTAGQPPTEIWGPAPGAGGGGVPCVQGQTDMGAGF